MELSQQYSLLEELIMTPKIDSSSSSSPYFLPNTWNFPAPQFDQTFSDMPSSDNFFINNDDNTLLDALFDSPDLLFGAGTAFYDHFTDLPQTMPPAGEELPSDVATTPTADDVSTNTTAAPKIRTKPKKADGQPSKNLMAERRRRKRLNDRLSMLRSIVPKISKMDRTSILGDTIDYVKELLDKIRKVRGEDGSFDDATAKDDDLGMIINGGYLKKEINNANDTQVIRNPPKFDVERRNLYDTSVDVCCAPKPGLLLSTLTTLDALGLDVQQCVISCFSDFSCKASCFEVAEHRSLVSTEDVKLALFRNAGYGGRCL